MIKIQIKLGQYGILGKNGLKFVVLAFSLSIEGSDKVIGQYNNLVSGRYLWDTLYIIVLG